GFTPYATMPPGEAFPRAKVAAQKALALDDSLAEAHAAMSQCAFFYDWDWGAAQRELHRALAIPGPNATLTQGHALTMLVVLGHVDEAISHARRIADTDPLSVNAAANLALVLYLARRHDEAIREARNAIDIDSAYPAAHAYLSFACHGAGRLDEAIAAMEQSVARTDQPFQKYGNTGWIYGVAGRRQDALRMLDRLTEVAARSYVSPNCFAQVYCGLGDGDNWARTMRASLEERSGLLVFIKCAAWCDPMRSHPYFEELLRHIGLP
ncbi:MAG: tetratricopeptide repeat protein, partial [Acidobacteria bacterium]|nr:tetratricopeptide repeat protein [Acidobacteriota bacterium]